MRSSEKETSAQRAERDRFFSKEQRDKKYRVEYYNGEQDVLSFTDAIYAHGGLPNKDGVNLVKFDDGCLGWVGYTNGEESSWVKYLEESANETKANNRSQTIDVKGFVANFEPYILDENIESDYDYDGRTYGYDDDVRRNIYLRVGDRNSDVVFSVVVSDITDMGQYTLDIDDVENVGLDDITPLVENNEVWSAIDELISNEIVFDETH